MPMIVQCGVIPSLPFPIDDFEDHPIDDGRTPLDKPVHHNYRNNKPAENSREQQSYRVTTEEIPRYTNPFNEKPQEDKFVPIYKNKKPSAPTSDNLKESREEIPRYTNPFNEKPQEDKFVPFYKNNKPSMSDNLKESKEQPSFDFHETTEEIPRYNNPFQEKPQESDKFAPIYKNIKSAKVNSGKGVKESRDQSYNYQEETAQEYPSYNPTQETVLEAAPYQPYEEETKKVKGTYSAPSSYSAGKPIGSGEGYFKGYVAEPIVLKDDATFEARFPFPPFPQ